MDNSVALVQAYVRVNGYFTVTESRVRHARPGRVPHGDGSRRARVPVERRHQLVISLGHVVQFLRSYLDEQWDVLRHSDTKDPAVGFLMTLGRAERGATP